VSSRLKKLTIQLGDEICEMKHFYHGEVTRIFLQELLLLVLSYRMSVKAI
jgi:hypothetical protein